MFAANTVGEDTEALIRPQVLHNQRRRLHGELMMVGMPGAVPLTILLGCALAAIAALLVVGQYTRHERVHGFLRPEQGVVEVRAPRSARVLRLHVAEQAQVAAGDVLATLEDPAAPGASAMRSLEAEAAALREQLDAEAVAWHLRREALRARAGQLDARRALLVERLRMVDARRALLARNQERLQRLSGPAQAAATERDAADLALLGQAAERAELELRVLELAQQAAELERELETMPADWRARQAQLQLALEQIQARRVAHGDRRYVTLRAPRSGRVTALGIAEGDSLAAGQRLLRLLPAESALQAVLLVPTRAVGFLAAGQQVNLLIDAYPHARFGAQPGVVLRVARSALSPAEVPPPGQAAEPVFEVHVRPARPSVAAYGRDRPLQAGMTLQADIATDRRRLITWMVEPLLALRGRV